MALTRSPLLAAAGSLALALGACGSSSVTQPAVDAARMLELVNEARATETDCGDLGTFAPAPPLALEARLGAAAQLHTEDMQARGRIGHDGSDGSTAAERVDRQGYRWSSVGENVASGYPSAEAVMAGWLESPGHCANIMRDAFTELGVGRVDVYWTLVFARPR